MTDASIISESELVDPVIVPVKAYICRDYASAEQGSLWQRVWQVACRVEDLSEIGSFVSYEIGSDSVVVVRSSEQEIQAFHNVCAHRGRRLVEPKPGERNASGRRSQFVCGYHGWRYGLDGANTHIPKEEHWQGKLSAQCASLTSVRCEQWGGWVWINLNENCESLLDYLGPIPEMLDPFELQNMRCRWRKWGVFDCNWKVALEAFNETYHVATTHPEVSRYGDFSGWARTYGLHSCIGYDAPKDMDKNQQAKLRISDGPDPRVTTAEMQRFIWEKANTNTTQTLVDAAERLKDELPEGTPPDQVLKHWLTSARAADEARGVVWPTVDPEHVAKSGTSWQVFPNFQIGHAVNNMLCYGARPYGGDPNKCIFEGAVYELYPNNEGPQPPWEFCGPTAEEWCFVLAQDFSNMAAVQQGMKSAGFKGNRINPYMERATANLHRNLARFMGTGSPRVY